MKARKALVLFLVMSLAVFGFVAMAQASNTATQTVTFQVQAINEISLGEDPDPLIISTATAGSKPDSAQGTSTYAFTTNEEGKKITAKIDTAMPMGTDLYVELEAPTGGTSSGQVELTTTDNDVVTGIEHVAESGKTITYTFSADPTADVMESTATTTVTFTLMDA
ncbi:MAG: hypothetical protein ACOYCB_12270 [Fastidiosipilaceae bacterium]